MTSLNRNLSLCLESICVRQDVVAKRTLSAKEHSSDYIYLNYITTQTTQNCQEKKNLTFKFILLGNFNVLIGFLLIFFIHFIFIVNEFDH